MSNGMKTNDAAALPATANAKSSLAPVMPRSSAAIPHAIETGNIMAKTEPAKDAEPYVASASVLKDSTPMATHITAASPPIAEKAPVITPNHIRAFNPNACLTPMITVAITMAWTNGMNPETPEDPGIIVSTGSLTVHTVFSAS